MAKREKNTAKQAGSYLLAKACELKRKYNAKVIYANAKGEFFTEYNLALASVTEEKEVLIF